MKRLVILGFGGYGKTVADVVESAKMYDEIIFLDDNSKDERVKGVCKEFVNYIDGYIEAHRGYIGIEFVRRKNAL